MTSQREERQSTVEAGVGKRPNLAFTIFSCIKDLKASMTEEDAVPWHTELAQAVASARKGFNERTTHPDIDYFNALCIPLGIVIGKCFVHSLENSNRQEQRERPCILCASPI